jgi:hypothetical protein
VTETAVKRLLCCGPLHTGRDGARVSVLVEDMSRNKCFLRLEYHTFYVLYPFVTYLLSLPSSTCVHEVGSTIHN